MHTRYPVFCDTPELAVECALVAGELGIAIDPEVVSSPFESAGAAAGKGQLVTIVLAAAPDSEALAAFQTALQHFDLFAGLAVLGNHAEARRARDVASDLGFVATRDVRPLLAALALADAGAVEPWTCSVRTLSNADRARLRSTVDGSQRVSGHLLKMNATTIGWAASASDTPHALGDAGTIAEALAACRAANPSRQAIASVVDDVDERAVMDVLFGPARSLSDPASKAALIPFGIPVPNEELCGSASRASSEATRLGFPVRIALASPDLRVWQHADLVVDMVDNAARVRETFRLLTALAQARAPNARILGVTVAATADCHALLSIAIRPLTGGLTETTIGFADAHGIASHDQTTTVLPASVATIERVLSRLRGSALILSGSTSQRRAAISEIADVLLRAAAFATAHAREVALVELRPVAVLTGGGVEVREACVTVNDAFEQSYQRSAGLG